jgi:hypothetical protein
MAALLVPEAGSAQQAAAGPRESADLAKQLANPIASLVSAPFQFRWTDPINAVVSKLSFFSTFPASYQLRFGSFPIHPDTDPSWKIRGAIVILLPRRTQS